MIDPAGYEVLTFDCYGTLIDWERGILNALMPIAAACGATVEPEAALVHFGRLETQFEAGSYVEYRVVLTRVLEGLGAKFGFKPTRAEREAFAQSVADWPVFPDSGDALRALAKRYKLAIISNIDDDLFQHSANKLGAKFDWIITAQQVRSYKPSENNFLRAFERIAVPRGRILHVAQSRYHDIGPAKRLGLSTVWVNRRHDKQGEGATPPSDAVPDLEVPDLATLAQHLAP
jgi:2-haloacid dehalogenase